MSAAAILYRAADLVARHGHNPHALDGDPVTGYSVSGAIRAATTPTPGESTPLALRLQRNAAALFVLAALGFDPTDYEPTTCHVFVDLVGYGVGDRPLGAGWAAAVLEQAARLAAAGDVPPARVATLPLWTLVPVA